ncbi:hypothetical protein HMPREF0220_1609 [Clostridioides difficile NAP08]|uniref:Uncharacterized protein n=1 Tax=Clostridioides difficile NAP08 TaxID=525259 RepID=D5Q3X7_CLODI|nr:hypothetical protein HMPREF0220_1609 [Clostridioides difficile NAP08]EFH15665.1 hypothetical protein HMPREF0219_1788 [Clostridioides difficile NAP07]
MWYVKKSNESLEDRRFRSFILTMWYVKLFSLIILLRYYLKFYINYVVCKDMTAQGTPTAQAVLY